MRTKTGARLLFSTLFLCKNTQPDRTLPACSRGCFWTSAKTGPNSYVAQQKEEVTSMNDRALVATALNVDFARSIPYPSSPPGERSNASVSRSFVRHKATTQKGSAASQLLLTNFKPRPMLPRGRLRQRAWSNTTRNVLCCRPSHTTTCM